MRVVARLLGALLLAGVLLPSATALGAVPAASGCGQAVVPLSAPATPQVTTSDVHLRQGPGLACAVVEVVSAGTPVTLRSSPVSANGYEWVDVSVGQAQGWVAVDYLGPADQAHKVQVLMY